MENSYALREGAECQCQCPAERSTYKEDTRECVNDLQSKINNYVCDAPPPSPVLLVQTFGLDDNGFLSWFIITLTN